MNNINQFAEVYLDIKTRKVDHAFEYIIPSKLKNSIKVGSIVSIPLKSRMEIGYVSKIKDRSKLPGKDIKFIDNVISPKPFFSKEKLELINWISSYYIQSAGRIFKLFLPTGGRKKIENILSNPEMELKYRCYFRLNKDRYLELKDKINWKKSFSQKKIIDYLVKNKEVPGDVLVKDTGSSLSSIKTLINKKIIRVYKRRVRRDFKYEILDDSIKKKQKIVLNIYQKKCLDSIVKVIDKNTFNCFLIEGVTGSGKTEIYISVCKEILSRNKKALILTPEIILTPQLYSRFKVEFGNKVAVYHSNMSVNERYETWLDIWKNKYNIIIGTRSALFTPINELGVIIIDEEHDTSYKESSSIRYNTQDVAIKIGEILNIPVVFGSATPSVNIRYRAENNKNFMLLKVPVKAQSKNPIMKRVIDLKLIDKYRDDTVITGELFKEINKTLINNNKVIILMNRRGYSNFAICNDCGNVPKCPACNLSYKFHRDGRKLICHHCGKEEDFTGVCKLCGGKNIFLQGTGIQKVESKLRIRFKNVPILRIDSDSTKKKKSHEEILKKFISPGGAILIGTQMIAKGLDIGDVTLVGIINCDYMLELPDYHMYERVYQLITQVAGRAGRKSKRGMVIIQTYNPLSNVIKSFLSDDYNIFYKAELENRRELSYPPFSNLINIVISGKNEGNVKKDVKKIFAELDKVIKIDYKILGPAPAPFYKINLFYRWHILIKTKEIEKFSVRINKILKYFKESKDSKIIIDVDPVWIL
ncbi:MAG: primosomal protein N' [Actinobacteria bacterium]|nr:primosomal protein N' [Actinomycetota bacterium]MBL7060593.1 primosomal protein N' [Actinomycetota bacterium]